MKAQFTIGSTKYRYTITSGVVVNFEALPTADNIEEVFVSGSWIPFTGSIDLTNVTTYQLQITTQDGVPLSRVYNIQLYSECDVFEKYDVVFLDRLGSWISIAMNKADYLSTNVERAEIRRKQPVNYTPKDAGLESFHVEENLVYTLNSGQLSETEYFFLRELISTPKAYVSINGGELQAINILNNNLELLKQRTAKQRNLSIQFSMATQDEING